MKNQDEIRRTSASLGSVPELPESHPVGVGEVPVSHADRAHAKLSPSGLRAAEICPGFLADKSQPIHPATLRGTACHEAVESGVDTGLSEEERGWVKLCRDYVADVMPENCERLHEVRLDIVDGMWGFADLIILGTFSAALIDFKFGQNAQEDVETNPAAQAYVLGMFQKWPGLETIHVHYLYPRREEISKHTYTRKDAPMIRLRVETIVDRVKNFEAWEKPIPAGYHGESGKLIAKTILANPVPDNCQYCARKATCHALHKMVLPLATRYANNHNISLAEPDFSVVKSPEQWSALLAYAPVLEQMSDSIKRHALEFREQTGVEIPGYEMRSRKGKAKIVNPEIAYKVAAEFGVTHEQFMSCTEVSAAQLRKAVEENAAKGQKSKVAAAMEGSLRDAGVLELGGESFFLGRVRA